MSELAEAPGAAAEKKSILKVEVPQVQPIGNKESSMAKTIDALGAGNASNPDNVFEALLEFGTDSPVKSEAEQATPPKEGTVTTQNEALASTSPHEAKQTNPDASQKTVETPVGEELPEKKGYVSLDVDLSDSAKAQIQELRNPTKVGKDAYGDGLVNKNHKGKDTPEEHEAAQAKAYTELDQKIEGGVINPKAIASEICIKLGVEPGVEEVPATYEDIVPAVNLELARFLEQGNLNPQEFASIQNEVVQFTRLYGEAFGKESVPKTFELVRDNARKLTYQNAVDKDVFSGSDHGTRHIIDGNTKFATQMVASLRENGVVVSAKDEVIIHQIMIDHDLGYTTGAAQSPEAWEGSKDHPLVSAKFIEENKAYYVDKFGEDGYAAVHDSVLNHSYPRMEYQSDGTDALHPDLVRGITSTVDGLGVTVETKTPEFFWNPDAIKTLLKIRLAMETGESGKVSPEQMTKYKQELQGIASREPNPVRAAGYKNAVDNFFNEVTADNTLGHFTGVVRNVRVEVAPKDTVSDITQEHAHSDDEAEHSEIGHEKLRLVVELTPTEVYAMLGNMFGDKLSNQSFAKAMKDLGIDTSQLQKHGRELINKINGSSTKSSRFVSETRNARVILGDTFLEDEDTPEAKRINEIAKVFRTTEALSIRTEINTVLDNAELMSTTEGQNEVTDKFVRGITEKTTSDELLTLKGLILSLSDNSPSGEKDSQGNDITISQKARQALKGFLTQKERDFLGV